MRSAARSHHLEDKESRLKGNEVLGGARDWGSEQALQRKQWRSTSSPRASQGSLELKLRMPQQQLSAPAAWRNLLAIAVTGSPAPETEHNFLRN